MSQTNQAESKTNKVQTALTYKQTKPDQNGLLGIKQASKTKRWYNNTEPSQNSKSKQAAGNQTEPCIATKQDVVSEIPAIVTLPEIRRVLGEEGVTKIVVDLETSSLAEDTEICQIAATDGFNEFNVYIIPKGRITSGASAVTKLSKKRGKLYQGENPVDGVYLNEGLTRLLAWLQLRMPCLLIAHNARAFDAKHLLKAVASCKKMQEFSQKVLGFADSLTAFREQFPERKTCAQPSLAKDLLGATYNAHNALDDVRMLQKLVSKFISDDLLLKHSFTVFWYRDYLAHTRMAQENMESLKPLLKAGKISERIAMKIAGSGLRMSHMEFAYQSGGVENLCGVLTELHEKKPRVTNNKKILENICSFFEESTMQKLDSLSTKEES